ncbi:MAG TPA: DUF3263 domain-containing protein [Rugosimonospora sp.]|nr:DUF3263 domain-containing protein [Rugosimonospora sp.]
MEPVDVDTGEIVIAPTPMLEVARPHIPRQVPAPPEIDDVVDDDQGGGPGLAEREREMLAFERKWWKHAGAKEQAIRDQFDLSATRYYQVLNALLDNPAAVEHDPVLVGRLRRLRATRSRARTAGRRH